MKIYDSHAHLKHGDAARTEYTPEAIVETMDEAGIEKSVVFAMSTTTRHSIDMALNAAKAFPDRLIPYVYALPSYERPALSEIESALSELGFRGIKIHAGECKLAEYVVDPVLALAGERDVPCLIDFCGDIRSASRIAGKFGKTKLIVAHMGQYFSASGDQIDGFIELAEAHENVLLDVSGVALLWKVEDAAGRIGSDRLLFGTDGPHPAPDTASFARIEIDRIRMLDLGPEQQEDIFWRTIAGLLKLG